jgi:hypothetical protein
MTGKTKVALVLGLILVAVAVWVWQSNQATERERDQYYRGEIEESCNALNELVGEPFKVADGRSAAATVNLLASYWPEARTYTLPLITAVDEVNYLFINNTHPEDWDHSEVQALDAAMNRVDTNVDEIRGRYCSG